MTICDNHLDRIQLGLVRVGLGDFIPWTVAETHACIRACRSRSVTLETFDPRAYCFGLLIRLDREWRHRHAVPDYGDTDCLLCSLEFPDGAQVAWRIQDAINTALIATVDLSHSTKRKKENT